MADLNGTWYNELGSVMKLQTNGNLISGTYQTAVGDARGIYRLTGLTDSDDSANQAVGFVVVWQNEYNNSHSVTSWSGQFLVINNTPTILTTWLLTKETNPGDTWRSTLVGQDTFTPVQKSEEEIIENIKKGVKSSAPALK